MLAVQHEGQTFSEDEAKAGDVYSYYNSILGMPFTRTHRINLAQLSLPRLDLSTLAEPFTLEEVARAVMESPSDRAPGPDGFGVGFVKAVWAVMAADIMRAFSALWSMDFRNFNCLNEALMVLLHKTQNPVTLRYYRPISLIHTIGKLFAKTLALRLQPFICDLINLNQTAFIKGRRIHENFRTVQLACRWLHGRKIPMILLKVDLAKAFDTMC